MSDGRAHEGAFPVYLWQPTRRPWLRCSAQGQKRLWPPIDRHVRSISDSWRL